VALRYDLLVEQGADYERLFPVFDGNGAPANVDGWTVTGQIRGSYGDTTVLHTLTLVPTGTNVRLTIPAATSAAWAWRLARFDIELTAPNTTVTRLVEGAVVVYPEITRTV
jgi:hypothetical protein